MKPSVFKMNKQVFVRGDRLDESQDQEYWFHQSPLERLEALEFLRQTFYDYDPIADRIQRVFSITQQPWS